MSSSDDTGTRQTTLYEVRIKGHLGPEWKDWFEGVTITLDGEGEALLTVEVVDQAALHGLLKRVFNLGIPLISVNRAQD